MGSHKLLSYKIFRNKNLKNFFIELNIYKFNKIREDFQL